METGAQQTAGGSDSPSVVLDVSSNGFADAANLPLLPNEADSKIAEGLRGRRVGCPSEAAIQTEGSDTPPQRRKGLTNLARCNCKTVIVTSLFAFGVLLCVYFTFFSEGFVTRDNRLTRQLYDEIDDQIRSNGRMVTLGNDILGSTYLRIQGRVPMTIVQASVTRTTWREDQGRTHIELRGRVPSTRYRGQPTETEIGLRMHYHCSEMKVSHLEGANPNMHLVWPGCDPWKPCEGTLVRILSKLTDWLRELEAPTLSQYYTYHQQPWIGTNDEDNDSRTKRQSAESALVQIGFIAFGLCLCLVLVCTCYIFVSEPRDVRSEARSE